MSKVQIIEAQKEKIDRSTGKIINKMRVAAYCRVSTDSDEQINRKLLKNQANFV
jgi:predicted site-specific integrase-resolvase